MQAFLRQMIQILALHAFENHEYSHLFACFLVCSPVSELFGRHYLLFNLRNLLYLIGRDVVSTKKTCRRNPSATGLDCSHMLLWFRPSSQKQAASSLLIPSSHLPCDWAAVLACLNKNTRKLIVFRVPGTNSETCCLVYLF